MESWDDDGDIDLAAPIELRSSRPFATDSTTTAVRGSERHSNSTDDEDDSDWDEKTSTIKASDGAALAAAVLAAAKTSGTIRNLGSTKVVTQEGDWDVDLGLDADTPLSLPMLRPRASFASQISDEPDEVTAKLSLPKPAALVRERAAKSSITSQYTETDEDADMEVGFDLPAALHRAPLVNRSVRDQVSVGSPRSREKSSASSITSPSPLAALRPPSAASDTSRQRGPGSSATFSDIADEDARFFEDIELPTAFFGDPGAVTPPDSAGKGKGASLQAILNAKLAARLAGEVDDEPTSFVERRNEAFEEGLVIEDDQDWTTSGALTAALDDSPLRTRAHSSRRSLPHQQRPAPVPSRSRVPSSPGVLEGRATVEPSRPVQRVARHIASRPSLDAVPSFSPAPSPSPRPPSTDPGRQRLAHKKSTPLARRPMTPISTSSSSRSLARRPSTFGLSEASSSPPTSASYAQPTVASRARQATLPSSTSLRDLMRSPTAPPARPSTPAGRGAANRLTMPTLSSRAKARPSISSAADPTGRTSAAFGVRPASTQTQALSHAIFRHLGPATRARKSQQVVYGDGTELDGFDDLPTNLEKERPFMARAPLTRTSSLTSPRVEATPARWRTNTTEGILGRQRRPTTAGAPRAKPHLIRNLNPSKTARVEGKMTWNPTAMRWEGNEEAIRVFDSVVTSSARPALIAPYVPAPTKPGLTFGLGGVRIVGDMIFDPAKMCWFNRHGEPEEELDFGDDGEDSMAAGPDARELARLKPKPSFLSGPEAVGAPPGAGAERFWKTCVDAERRHATELEPWLPMIDGPGDDDRSHLWELRRIVMNSRK